MGERRGVPGGFPNIVLIGCLVSSACMARTRSTEIAVASDPTVDAASATPPKADVPSKPRPRPDQLPVNEEGDCPAICDKLIHCKHGPWETDADCRLACEAATDDETSARTYRCVAAATSCEHVQRCGR